MSQVLESPLEEGRDAVRRRDWDAAYPLLSEADKASDLAPEDLELLAEAALWGGLFGEYMEANERAYKAYVESGNLARAAYIATLLAHDYRAQLQPSVASGWLSRAKRHLDETDEAPEHGYWALQRSLVALGEHDYDEAFRQGKTAEDIGKRFADRSLEIRGIQRQGAALLEKGEVGEGKLLLDEASAAALGGELDPYSTLVVYCNTIGAHREVSDFDSAAQWTERATQFCDANSMSAFPGMCRVNWAEVMRYKGRLNEAEELAGQAGEELRTWCPRIAGAAFYELGETRLRLGDLAQAEQAFREADEHGHNPEPGHSLLRLARGDAKGAWSSIRRLLADETIGLAARTTFLPAGIEVAVAAGELDAAEKYAAELEQAAGTFETSALKAAASYAHGKIALARDDADRAESCFRNARTIWESTGASYDSARAREQRGLALRAGGDEEAAVWELEAAAARFERLGAARDADRVAEALMRDVSRAVMKTFVFTDIVGSTELASTLEDRHWNNVLRRHDETLRTIFADHGGQVVDHTGDGFFAAFEEQAEALNAAVAVQRAISQEFEFDLRIGVHTDGALARGENYHGKGVHAAARIGAAAQGQEILASRETMEKLPQFKTSDHREIALKGFKDDVPVCSVDWS
ncbi:MAG TPA: adenylate/guanylate cyclase domain-containing protein [Gaiellaceae bacterium]|jgi:class 3 adenylate cyclase|nr:adenylate/guanylate cyclase domain-containing protein [Gaiellaceae bacterium]